MSEIGNKFLLPGVMEIPEESQDLPTVLLKH